MDVEPSYPLFSPELELAEALASTQQKFQTLNFADYKVMRQLLPMTLVCHPTCLGSMVSNPDRTSEDICRTYFLALTMYEDIELDNFCSMKAPEQLKTFLNMNMKVSK